MRKIIVAIDSFKGCLPSARIAQAAANGIHRVFPRCNVLQLPVADGGEGTSEALVRATGGSFRSLTVRGPLGQPVRARYGILGDNRSAVIEMAAASGLPLVPQEKRNPLLTTTFGTGQLVADALKRGCRHFILGIGGSATNDAGAGLLQALGWQFLDASGKPLGVGGQILQKIARINPSNALPELRDASFHAACDVDNPFHGPRGAAFVFGPQKGATPAIVRQLDAGLKNFARVIRRQLGRDISKLPGAGAAGGLGGGLSAFLNARLTPGIELVLNTLRFDKLLRGADLVITGEGRMDAQTAMGKAPAGIAAAAKKHGVPVIAIAGAAEDFPALNKAGIDAIFPLPPRPMTLAEAMTPNAAAANIQRLATQICSLLKATSRPPKTQPPLHQKK